MPKRRRHRRTQTRPALGSGPGPGSASSLTISAASPADGVHRVTTREQAAALAAHLLDAARASPVAVVSVPSSRTEPWIDAVRLASDTDGLADVYLLAHQDTSWALSNALPPMTQVYGGAGRVYPTGSAWCTDPYVSPLRFAYSEADGEPATDALIQDALRMAHVTRRSDHEPVPGRQVTGAVARLVPPSRALVRLDDGGIATVWQELTVPDVGIERLLTPAMRVTGVLDDANRLDIREMVPGTVRITYRRDDVVLAQVRAVRPDVVHLALAPDAVVPVARHRVTGNDQDALTSLFSEGEVVVARVTGQSERGLSLRLDDIDDDEEPLPAPAVLEGGPPWLEPPSYDPPVREAPTAPTPTAERGGSDAAPSGAFAPTPAPTPPRSAAANLTLSLDAARAEIRRLEKELAGSQGLTQELEGLRRRAHWLEDERMRGLQELAALRTHLRRRTTGRSSHRRRSTDGTENDDGALFTDPAEQFRFEVHLAWARRIPAADKATRPLRPYMLSSDFLPSLERLQGVSRAKVIDVVVEVLTGLAQSLPSRAVHQLRDGSGTAPALHAEGWTAWRVNLQTNTPAARRLHYWTRGEQIEFWEVSTHDDAPV